MNIIVDTREQKPLSFTGHSTCRRKLDEGDYNIKELEDKIVIERKSLQDLYGSIIQDHARFKREILRAKEKGKTFYIFIEGTLQDFYFLNWSDRAFKITPAILEKIVMTMTERYNLIFIECPTRRLMSSKIIETIKENKKLYGIWFEEEKKMVDTTKAKEGKYITADLVKESLSKKCVIINEGEFVDGDFGEKFQITVEIDGKQKIWSPNKDSICNMHDAYGKDSKAWIGKIVKFKVTKFKGKDTVTGEPVSEPTVTTEVIV